MAKSMRFRLKQKSYLYLKLVEGHWLGDLFKLQLSHLFNGDNNNHSFYIAIKWIIYVKTVYLIVWLTINTVCYYSILLF